MCVPAIAGSGSGHSHQPTYTLVVTIAESVLSPAPPPKQNIGATTQPKPAHYTLMYTSGSCNLDGAAPNYSH